MICQDYRDKVEQEANTIRRKLEGTTLYGWPVSPNDVDAMLVAALKWASKNNYDGPMMGFDESDDIPDSVWKCFDWDNAPVTTKE